MCPETAHAARSAAAPHEIHELITGALAQTARQDADRVRVVVVDHVAWLSGSVSSLQARLCAAVAARSARGIDEVRNNIQVR